MLSGGQHQLFFNFNLTLNGICNISSRVLVFLACLELLGNLGLDCHFGNTFAVGFGGVLFAFELEDDLLALDGFAAGSFEFGLKH